MLLDRRRLASLIISCKSCARGVALSRLYLTGLTSVDSGGRGGCESCCLNMSVGLIFAMKLGKRTLGGVPFDVVKLLLSALGEVLWDEWFCC